MSSVTDCKPCKEKSKNVTASVSCRKCKTPLCSTCKDSHKKINVLKHQLNGMKLFSSVNNKSNVFCSKHFDSTVNLLCASHDELCCRHCVTEKHSKCTHVFPIETASKHFHKNSKLSSISKSLNNLLDVTKNIKKSKERNLQEIKNDESNVKKQVSETKRRFIDQINKLEKGILSDLNKRKEEIVKEIKKNSDALGKIDSAVKTALEKVDLIKDHGSDSQAFLLCHQLQTELRNMEESLNDIISELTHFNITCGGGLDDMPLDTFDQLSVKSEKEIVPFALHSNSSTPIIPRHKRATSKSKLKHKFEIWPKGKAYGIAALDEDKLLICNYDARLLLKCNKDGKMLEQLSMKSAPNKVALLPGKDSAVVTIPELAIVEFISVNCLSVLKTVELPGEGKGIAASSTRIVVGGEFALYILDIEGNLLKTLKVRSNFSFPLQYVHICADDSIIYTDTYNVYRVLSDYQWISEYGTTDVKTPEGIATDKQGRIYTVDRDTNSVVRLSAEGKYQKTIVGEKDGLKRPWALSFNDNFDTLYVSNRNGECIFVYSFII